MKFSAKPIMITIIIIAIIAVVGIIFYYPDAELPAPVKIDTANQPTLGNPKAKIHIVAFEDLKCHNCMRFNVEIFPAIKKAFIDSGKAKYTVINVAFIAGSMPAANAARCVYMQNKKAFFKYVKNIYNDQPPETENWATIPTLVNYADNIPEIDKTKLSQCIYKSPYTQLIKNNLKIAAGIMNGIVATPTIYVNGHIVKPLTINRMDVIIKGIKNQ